VIAHPNSHPQSLHPPLPQEQAGRKSPSPDNGPSWYTVPEPVKQALLLASTHWNQPELADTYINEALALAHNSPEVSPDVLVSAYRYFFYTQNYPLALRVATTVMEQVRASEALPQEWEPLKSMVGDRPDDPALRLYINAYAASGLIHARLGQIETAKLIAQQVSEIETRNEFGGNTVRQILEHPNDDEGDEP